MQVNIHEAKTKLSQLGKRVLNGEQVIICRAGKPYLELVPHRAGGHQRRPGRLKGRIHMTPDFDETPEEVIRAFEGDSG